MDFNEAVQATNFHQAFKIKQSRFWVSVAFQLPDEIASTLPSINSLKSEVSISSALTFSHRKTRCFLMKGISGERYIIRFSSPLDTSQEVRSTRLT